MAQRAILGASDEPWSPCIESSAITGHLTLCVHGFYIRGEEFNSRDARNRIIDVLFLGSAIRFIRGILRGYEVSSVGSAEDAGTK